MLFNIQISKRNKQKKKCWKNFINVGCLTTCIWIVLLFCWCCVCLFFVVVVVPYCTHSGIGRSMRKESQISTRKLITTHAHQQKQRPYQKPAITYFWCVLVFFHRRSSETHILFAHFLSLSLYSSLSRMFFVLFMKIELYVKCNSFFLYVFISFSVWHFMMCSTYSRVIQPHISP